MPAGLPERVPDASSRRTMPGASSHALNVPGVSDVAGAPERSMLMLAASTPPDPFNLSGPAGPRWSVNLNWMSFQFSRSTTMRGIDAADVAGAEVGPEAGDGRVAGAAA